MFLIKIIIYIYIIKTCEPCVHNRSAQAQSKKYQFHSDSDGRFNSNSTLLHVATYIEIFICPPQQRCPPIG